jgi:hypothetical protein
MKEKRRFIFELRIKAPLKKGNIQVKQNWQFMEVHNSKNTKDLWLIWH